MTNRREMKTRKRICFGQWSYKGHACMLMKTAKQQWGPTFTLVQLTTRQFYQDGVAEFPISGCHHIVGYEAHGPFYARVLSGWTFAFKDPQDAMLFKLKYGGAA